MAPDVLIPLTWTLLGKAASDACAGHRPIVVSPSPIKDPTASGTGVTIGGAHLRGTVTVTFGGVPATSVSEVNNTTVTARAPAHLVGFVDVVVIAACGTSANTAADDFTYIAAGVIRTELGGSSEFAEDRGTEHYKAVLTAAPLGNVTVSIAPDSQVTTDLGSLIFTTETWSDVQIVAVTAVDDTLAERSHSGSIRHVARGGAYGGVAISDVVATSSDNDAAAGRHQSAGRIDECLRGRRW